MAVKIIGREDQPTKMVLINDSWYEMNAQANQPNGVCTYHGERTDPDNRALEAHGTEYYGDVPRGMFVKIIELLTT